MGGEIPLTSFKFSSCMARSFVLRWVHDIHILGLLTFYKNMFKDKNESAESDIISRTERIYGGHHCLKKEGPEIFVGFELSVHAGNVSLRVANPNRLSLPMYLNKCCFRHVVSCVLWTIGKMTLAK